MQVPASRRVQYLAEQEHTWLASYIVHDAWSIIAWGRLVANLQGWTRRL